jgi:hypothetical protein
MVTCRKTKEHTENEPMDYTYVALQAHAAGIVESIIVRQISKPAISCHYLQRV